jgi:hypothetical protein
MMMMMMMMMMMTTTTMILKDNVSFPGGKILTEYRLREQNVLC